MAKHDILLVLPRIRQPHGIYGGTLSFQLVVHPVERPRYIIKIKMHSRCEVEYFVETHLCKLCVILRSRVLRVLCPH